MSTPMPPASAVVAGFLARRALERAASINARRARAEAQLPALVALLASRGATRVWLFGSLAWGTAHAASDIDLAVEGLPREALFTVQGELLRIATVAVDVVPIDEAPPALRERIRREGRLIHG